jgi:hypothetical protein
MGWLISHHVVTPTVRATVEGLLEAVFCMVRAKEFSWRLLGDREAKTCESLEATKRDSSAWGYSWVTLFLGDVNMRPWPSTSGGGSRTWDTKIWTWVPRCSDPRMIALHCASIVNDGRILSSERMLHKNYNRKWSVGKTILVVGLKGLGARTTWLAVNCQTWSNTHSFLTVGGEGQKFCMGDWEDRTWGREAEECPLLEAVYRVRLMKTHKAGKRLSWCCGDF